MQIDAYRAMGEDRRTVLAIEMSEDVRLVTMAGLRDRNPGLSERKLNLMLIELWHGQKTAALVRRSVSSARVDP